jgi:hypothetical protein
MKRADLYVLAFIIVIICTYVNGMKQHKTFADRLSLNFSCTIFLFLIGLNYVRQDFNL